jgi:hypothetical protein
MKDSISLGSVPAYEKCEQLGPNYRPEVARAECNRYIAQLRSQFGPEPQGARLFIKRNQHDFGTYLEVEVEFDDNNEAAIDYAFKLEREAPSKWTEVIQ